MSSGLRSTSGSSDPKWIGDDGSGLVWLWSALTCQRFFLRLLQTCLLEDTIQRSGRHVNIGFSRYGDGPASVWMLELAMTASSSRKVPTTIFKKLDNLSDFHSAIML
jgi:hypothetical protein